MRDLYRCLDECSPELLDAVASAWEVSLPKGTSQERAQRLAETMLAPDAIKRVLADLSDRGQEALAEIM